MTIEKALKAAHSDCAAVAGAMSLCLTKRKVTKNLVGRWIELLQLGIRDLEKLNELFDKENA